MRKKDAAAVEWRIVQFSPFKLNAKFPNLSKVTPFFITCGHCLEAQAVSAELFYKSTCLKKQKKNNKFDICNVSI